MNKIINYALSAALILGTLSPVYAADFHDVPNDDFFAPSVSLLSECGIMQGMGDGYFSPNSGITRAEMSVLAAKTSDSTLSGGVSCIFNDVADNHWGIRYINTAADKGYLIGYPDGSFAPDKNLTYAEVTAVVLRLMGYTARELGRYPEGYLDKASQLGITSGLILSANDTVDRKTTAYILANALLKDKNNSSSKLISDLGYNLSNEVTILSGYNASTEEIATSGGVFNTSISDTSAYIGMRGKLVQDSDNKVIGFVPFSQDIKTVTISNISGNQVNFTDEYGNSKNVYIPSDSMVYYHDEQNEFSSVKSLINSGDKLYFAEKGSAFDYGVVARGSAGEGYVIYDTLYNCGISGEFDNISVVRNGYPSDVNELKKYDVVYRGENNTIYAYSKKVSGIYESASPTLSNPVSVCVSGNDYTIENETAKRQLGDYSNSLKPGDNITLFLGRSGEIAGAVKTSDAGRCVGIRSILGNDVSCFENGNNITVHMDNSQNVVFNGKSTTYGAVKNDLNGELLLTLFYNENGSLDYGVFEEYELNGPLTASGNGINMFGSMPVTTVVRKDKLVNISDIRKNDIVYYSDALDTIYAYNDSISGSYEAAYPDKSAPTSVTVSGKKYEVETSKAQNLLSKCEINSTVTLLLGREGKIADVLTDMQVQDSNSFGVILSCAERVSNGTKEYIVNALTNSGQMLEIKTSKKYNDFRGRAVRFTYNNGIMTPTGVKASLSGTVDHTANKIGGLKMSDDCKIIDISYKPESNETTNAKADYVTFSKITKKELINDDILFYTSDDNGEITFLVLNNVTHSAYNFGIATKSSENNSFNYTLDFSGTEREYRLDKNIIVGKGTPVMLLSVDGKAVDIEKLYLIKNSSDVGNFSEKQIVLDNESYTLEDNASYYRYEDNKYILTSVQDLKDMKISSASIYSDHSVGNAIASRIVIVTIK